MKLDQVYNHHNASAEWARRDLHEWLTDVFEAPHLKMFPGCTADIRAHVQNEFRKEGWAPDVKLDQNLGLTVFAMRDDLAFQLQTGNMSRAPYDMLKLQHLFHSERIQAAALAVPMKECAGKIGDNIAYWERICNELQLFSRIITVPILVIGFS